MKLNPKYKYIGLDFETTGLDPSKDEPIQIGLVEIDNQGTIINEFSSLLKPQKNLNELKTIVGFITGIDVEDIAKAPRPEEILDNIKHFFGENTVLIGHNIKFDLQFLQKFFPTCSYIGEIDTFPLSQTFFHYQPSYALEVLIPGENAHNALQDTKNALTLFGKTVEKIEKIAAKYPILNNFISQKEFNLSPYLQIEALQYNNENFKDIPKLSKILPAHTQSQPNETTIDSSQLENQKRYYIGNISLKTFLERIVPNKNIVLAFSNLQKLDIAKSMLNNMGIKNIGFLKDEQMIDYEKFTAFLNKKTFSHEEVSFICKYYSHLDQGLGVLDLNNKSDYQIYHFIKNRKDKPKYPIVLATHQGLFSYLQDATNEYQEYDILFFDAEWRYKSYNFFLSRPWDMYYTLNFIETLLYKHNLEQETKNNISENGTIKTEHLEQFYISFQIFIGQLFMESKNMFIGNSAESIQTNPITTESNFYKTNLLRKQIQENYLNLKEEVETNDFLILEKQLNHIDTLFNTVINIEKKMMNDDMYFVYSEHTQYTSWAEFIEIFPSNIYFFSNSDKKAALLFPNEIAKPIIKTTKIGLYDRILGYITNSSTNPQEYKQQSFFIVSTRKEESKQIFDTLYKNNLHTTYTILAENITGGAGKNIFKAKGTYPKILIGGYAFLLSVYANSIPLDEIIIFNIRGGNEQSILDDIQRYANK